MPPAKKEQNEANLQALLVVALGFFVVNIYYYALPFFVAKGFIFKPIVEMLGDLRKAGVFTTPLYSKGVIMIVTYLAMITNKGKGQDNSIRKIWTVTIVGITSYLLISPVNHPVLYIITSLISYGLILWSAAMIGRLLGAFRKADNDVHETFEQNQALIDTDISVNLRHRYQYQKRIHKGWINVVNPFRGTMIFGLPGSGKSFAIFNQFIEQMLKKGYTMLCYDYKYPDLTDKVYNELEEAYSRPQKDGKPMPLKPAFHIINFNDPRYSNRCNPMKADYITSPADSAEIADIVMKNIAPGMAEKEDFFSMSGKLYIDAVIYFLKIYDGGKYCTFPHMIELMSVDYEKLLNIMALFPQLESKVKPFINALRGKAQGQLQGQIASAQIPLGKIASPDLYWVLTEDPDDPDSGLSLNLSSKEQPKVICIGNNPDRQAIYGAALALYTSRVFKLLNHKGNRKSAVLLDELPTVFIKGLDNLIATARSNKVAIVMGAQDMSQLKRDYGEKESKVIINTVGNILSGAVNFDTAETLSKSFGKEFREQQSRSDSDSSNSVSTSYQLQEILPASKIETLSQGYFFGKVADNNDTPIDRKLFCGEILVDMKRVKEMNKKHKNIPIMKDFENEVREGLYANREEIFDKYYSNKAEEIFNRVCGRKKDNPNKIDIKNPCANIHLLTDDDYITPQEYKKAVENLKNNSAYEYYVVVSKIKEPVKDSEDQPTQEEDEILQTRLASESEIKKFEEKGSRELIQKTEKYGLIRFTLEERTNLIPNTKIAIAKAIRSKTKEKDENAILDYLAVTLTEREIQNRIQENFTRIRKDANDIVDKEYGRVERMQALQDQKEADKKAKEEAATNTVNKTC